MPEWLSDVLEYEVRQATDRIVAATTQEQLWTAKGRLEGATHTKESIEYTVTTLEHEENERRERTFSHGN